MEVPFFPMNVVESWTSPSGYFAAALVSHLPDQIGGTRYVYSSNSLFALFAGRPFIWIGDSADGRRPLDPSFYLGASHTELIALDGRFVAARYDDRRRLLEVITDRMGAYPVFETRFSEACLISNNAELLRRIRGTREMSLTSLSGILGGGWPLDGDPMWSDVHRVAGGGVRRVGTDGLSPPEKLPEDEPAALHGSGFRPDRAARLLIESVRALADWPGRPSVVPVTAGRD